MRVRFVRVFLVQRGAKFEKNPPRDRLALPKGGPHRARRPRSAQVRHATTAAESPKGPTLQKININWDMYAFYTLTPVRPLYALTRIFTVRSAPGHEDPYKKHANGLLYCNPERLIRRIHKF